MLYTSRITISEVAAHGALKPNCPAHGWLSAEPLKCHMRTMFSTR
jgi:hypothetical protein